MRRVTLHDVVQKSASRRSSAGFPEARFWPTSEWPTIRELSPRIVRVLSEAPLCQADSESNRSRQTYFGLRDSDCPGAFSTHCLFASVLFAPTLLQSCRLQRGQDLC